MGFLSYITPHDARAEQFHLYSHRVGLFFSCSVTLHQLQIFLSINIDDNIKIHDKMALR